MSTEFLLEIKGFIMHAYVMFKESVNNQSSSSV